MKRYFRALMAGALGLCLTVSAASAAVFSPVRSYGGAGFTDVPEDWSKASIVACYELGLMSGRSPELFVPDGTVSAAEAVTVAARVRDLRNGGDGVLPASQPWYQSAVDYAVSGGFLTPEQFPDYSAVITRAELAQILAQVLPQDDYAVINQVAALPDVSADSPYAGSIFKLYRAGILTGVDAAGSFLPEGGVTRAQLAAILCRLVDPDQRKHVTLSNTAQQGAGGHGTHELPAVDHYKDLDVPRFHKAELDAAVSSGALVFVDFYAVWCPLCQDQAPIIEELAKQYQDTAATIAIVNIREDPDLMEQYDILSIPTVLIFQDGAVVERFNESSKSLQEYAALLDSRL